MFLRKYSGSRVITWTCSEGNQYDTAEKLALGLGHKGIARSYDIETGAILSVPRARAAMA
jgi:hypothetical protein